MRVLSIFGTRPEAIKMAAVISTLKARAGVESLVCVTAQHREMLDQVLDLFAIAPDVDLDLMTENQTLAALTARAITGVSDVLERFAPDVVLVQGDTTTAMAAGLAAFYRQVPVGHVEAGLRTGRRYSPFPEEMNRRMLGALATWHFAPTDQAMRALREEGISASDIYVTGNTVIDALRSVAARRPSDATAALLMSLGFGIGAKGVSDGTRQVLVTAHRRESFGRPLRDICQALRAIVERNSGVEVVFPVHFNPHVRDCVFGMLGKDSRIRLIDPLPYEAFVQVLSRSYLVLTDSGGVQEEAPALGKPVLVLRDETERPEGVAAGAAKVVGTKRQTIVQETERLLHDANAYDRMACVASPYGDGRAAERIVEVLVSRLGKRRGTTNRRGGPHETRGAASTESSTSGSWLGHDR